MPRSAASLDDYLAQLSPAERAELQPLASRIDAVLPGARVHLDWGMPVWTRADGTLLAGIAAQKNNLALYLCPECGEDIYDGWRDRLPKSAIGKGCLRFRSVAKLPEGMVEALLARVAARA
jgi:uncharacterized protein YdhG (YjbR/CyaY superfamily)